MPLNALVQIMMSLPGASGAAIVDIDSGQTLARAGRIEAAVIEVTGIANARLLRAQIGLAKEQYNQGIEDVLIAFTEDYHLIRMIRNHQGETRRFLYLVLDRMAANLGLSRLKMTAIAEELTRSESESRLLDIECHYVMDVDSLRSKIERIENYGSNSLFAMSLSDEEIPAFMRTDVALKLLGVEPDACLEERMPALRKGTNERK